MLDGILNLAPWQALLCALIPTHITIAAVTIFLHRHQAHRALDLHPIASHFFRFWLWLTTGMGTKAWVAIHRKHHAHADHDEDPHNIKLGFRWAHVEWLYKHNVALPSDEEIMRYAPDLYADPYYRALARLALPLQVALAAALFFLGGWSWVIWGVFVRLVFSYHSTWFVNSAAHMLGYRSYRTTDRSTNCWWVAALAFGEGWHNNHHAFPFSARHGLAWFEVDMTWWHVKTLEFLRLADRIKVPSEAIRRRFAYANVRSGGVPAGGQGMYTTGARVSPRSTA